MAQGRGEVVVSDIAYMSTAGDLCDSKWWDGKYAARFPGGKVPYTRAKKTRRGNVRISRMNDRGFRVTRIVKPWQQMEMVIARGIET
jgi:hypothetical protein